MGIRMLHRRTAPARVHATATAEQQVNPDATPLGRPLPAFSRGAATPRVPRTARTALREAAARLGRLAPIARAEVARGYLALALDGLGRLRRPRAGRRMTVFVASMTPGGEPFSER
ncbi:hypothetical protein ACIHAR_21590 [Streptomyces sp. NPDC052016]|uniref:hypothetical protein n=1 Tax=Streptomyces sp. NPDC052016 TaxID=3365680 RepID=UPI0037D63A92